MDGGGDGSEGGARAEGGSALGTRLGEHWHAARFAPFYAGMAAEARAIVCGVLRREFSLGEHDSEDCFEAALEALVSKQNGERASVLDPYNYAFACARNAARDLVRARSEERAAVAERMVERGERVARPARARPRDEADDEPLIDHDAEIDHVAIGDERAVAFVEAIVDPQVVVEHGWAPQVVALAVSRMKGPQRAVVLHMLARDPGFISSEAPADLGMNASTYRSNKRRAFRALESLVPAAMRELGLRPQRYGIPEVFEAKPESFPSAAVDDESD